MFSEFSEHVWTRGLFEYDMETLMLVCTVQECAMCAAMCDVCSVLNVNDSPEQHRLMAQTLAPIVVSARGACLKALQT